MKTNDVQLSLGSPVESYQKSVNQEVATVQHSDTVDYLALTNVAYEDGLLSTYNQTDKDKLKMRTNPENILSYKTS